MTHTAVTRAIIAARRGASSHVRMKITSVALARRGSASWVSDAAAMATAITSGASSTSPVKFNISNGSALVPSAKMTWSRTYRLITAVKGLIADPGQESSDESPLADLQ